MVKHFKLSIAVLGFAALSLFTAAQAADKLAHGQKGANGGEVVQVGDREGHIVEPINDEKTGKLTIYFFLKDLRTTFTPNEAPKLILKTKSGNKQLPFTGSDFKWEVTDDVLKTLKFAKTLSAHLIVVLEDGKKYVVNLDAHAGHNHD